MVEKHSESCFKAVHGRFRRRAEDPDRIDDLDEMIDFSIDQQQTANEVKPAASQIVRLPDISSQQLQQSIQLSTRSSSDEEPDAYYTGPVFGLRQFPGFLYAPGALSTELQESLAYRAVTTYCEVPHVTNMDSSPPKPDEVVSMDLSMWQLWKIDQGLSPKTKKESFGVLGVDSASAKKEKPTKYYRTFRKLSWATMGYHYDWTARRYNDQAKSTMPTELERLGQLFAYTAWLLTCEQECDQHRQVATPLTYSYTASASIVNYYSAKSVMGGHRDDLELALDKPIVSFSMGRPAVFLLGGKQKDDSPVIPILVRPGDVMIMGGDCRVNYHSMARLLPADPALWPARNPTCCASSEQQISSSGIFSSPSRSGISKNATTDTLFDDQEEYQALARFLSSHRININLRQVYPD